MLEEPYRWVEAVRNRREYLEDQLQQASPVLGMGYDRGILLLTTTPGPRKVFEIYNRVAFAALGHPADIEKLRKAVIDIAHLEAFNFSASDVSLHRLVSFGVGPLMKTAFDEIFRSPYTARGLMAELDSPPDQDAFYTIDADGSFTSAREAAAVAGTAEGTAEMVRRLEQLEDTDLPLGEALQHALGALGAGMWRRDSGEDAEGPSEDQIRETLLSSLARLRLEAAVLDRDLPTHTKFRLLPPSALEPAVAAYSA
jgi:proteasome alpha subunit